MMELNSYRAPTQDEIAQLLASHNVMATPQRIEIARILYARKQHLSADEVLHRVDHEQHHVSKATVYNTLGLFVEKGLVRQVIVDPTKVFYDTNTSPHHHFYNVDNGALTDIDAGQINLGDLPDPPSNTVMDGVEVVIRVRNQPQS